MQGTVKWFNAKKGYGFVVGEDGKDIFVHYSGIISDKSYKELKDGQSVTFDITKGPKGDQAVNVRVVG